MLGIAETLKALMIEQGKTTVWLADHGLLKDAYETARGSAAGAGIRRALKAVAASPLFEKDGFILAAGFTIAERRHAVYRLKPTAAEAQT